MDNLEVRLSPDSESDPQVSVSILFSQKRTKNEISINEFDSGKYLDYSIKWPSMMNATKEMHRKFLCGNNGKKIRRTDTFR